MKMQRNVLPIMGSLLLVLAAQQALAVIPVQTVSGPFKQGQSKNNVVPINIGGHLYRAQPDTSVTGAKSIRDIPSGASVSAVIDGDGNVRALSVESPKK